MRHVCSRSHGRCLKRVGTNGEEVCRVPDHPESDHNYFKQKYNIYEDDVYEILKELGLAELIDLTDKEKLFDFDFDRGQTQKWEVDEHLKAGSWHYVNHSNEKNVKFIPVIPIMVCMLRCSCNTQICDLLFMVSYLVKYVVGKESRPYVYFNVGKKTEKYTLMLQTMITLTKKYRE